VQPRGLWLQDEYIRSVRSSRLLPHQAGHDRQKIAKFNIKFSFFSGGSEVEDIGASLGERGLTSKS
jgi:hypothetical protein